MTPIELIADAIKAKSSCAQADIQDISIDTVLVPEQCMMIMIGDKTYHITVEEVEE